MWENLITAQIPQRDGHRIRTRWFLVGLSHLHHQDIIIVGFWPHIKSISILRSQSSYITITPCSISIASSRSPGQGSPLLLILILETSKMSGFHAIHKPNKVWTSCGFLSPCMKNTNLWRAHRKLSKSLRTASICPSCLSLLPPSTKVA